MIFTGYNIRNIYPQDDIFNYLVDISCSNTTGFCNFGFSGNSGNLDFILSSGKVLLKKGNFNLFVNSYTVDESLLFSGNVGKTTHDLFINNQPMFFGENKNTGYYNYFYINSQNVETDLSLQINGNSPNYSYDPFESFYSGQNIPITINNSGNYPFKIFSGSVGNIDFNINGVNNVNVTGSYTFNITANNFLPFSQNVPIQLYTNFGNIVLDFTASGIPNLTGDFYLLFGPNNNIAINAQTNSYTISLKSYTGIELYVSLSYESGITGNYYRQFNISNTFTGNASGLITGSGTISSFITGQTYQYNSLLNQNEYGTGSVNVSSFIYSSGNVTGEFSVNLTGLGSGLISYLTGVTGYGVFTFNGVITPAGGILTRTDLTGVGSGVSEYGIYYGTTTSGVGSIFATFTGEQILSGIFDSNNYESVSFQTPLFFGTGIYQKFYVLSGLSYATGQRVSGIFLGDLGFDYEPGVYTFYKNYFSLGTGASSILTGFNPVEVTQKLILTSGYIFITGTTGTSSNSCDFQLPFFKSIGYPSIVRDFSGNAVYPININYIYPNDTGEFLYENSEYSLTGNTGNFRTNISRLGNTASGSGWFNNVFQKPFYTGDYYAKEYGWSEFLTGYYLTGNTSGKPPFIKQFVANSYFNESGLIETGRMDFFVTGNFTGLKQYVFKSSVSSSSQYSSISLYSGNGVLIATATGIDQMRDVCSGSLTYPDNPYFFNNPGDSYILTGLTTGKYFLISKLFNNSESGLGYIGFTNTGFSGCENWGNIYFSISRSGVNTYPFWGRVVVTNSNSKLPHASGIDYLSNSGNSINYGFYMPACTNSMYFSLPVVDDGNMEVGEYLDATLFIDGINSENRSYRSNAKIIILDNDNCCNGMEYCANTPTPPEYILPSGEIPFPPVVIDEPESIPDSEPPDTFPIGGGGGGGYTPGGPTDPYIPPPPTPQIPTKSCCNISLSFGNTVLVRSDSRPTSRECECLYNNCDCIKPEESNTPTLQIRRSWSLGTTCNIFNPALILEGFRGQAILIKNGVEQSRQFVSNYNNTYGAVTFSLEDNTPDAVYNIRFEVSYARICQNFDRNTGLPVSLQETTWFSTTSPTSNTTNISECNTISLPDGCCEYSEVEENYCDCEYLGVGSSTIPTCDPGYRLVRTTHGIDSSDCSCNNRGETIECYTCQLEEVGCNCSDYGLVEQGFCTGEEVGIENITITNESCNNWGTTITCSRCNDPCTSGVECAAGCPCLGGGCTPDDGWCCDPPTCIECNDCGLNYECCF